MFFSVCCVLLCFVLLCVLTTLFTHMFCASVCSVLLCFLLLCVLYCCVHSYVFCASVCSVVLCFVLLCVMYCYVLYFCVLCTAMFCTSVCYVLLCFFFCMFCTAVFCASVCFYYFINLNFCFISQCNKTHCMVWSSCDAVSLAGNQVNRARLQRSKLTDNVQIGVNSMEYEGEILLAKQWLWKLVCLGREAI